MTNALAYRSLIRRALLAWFRRHARPLPWRETKDAYRVWISEVMLQQTQLDTVIPFYERFIAAFPTVEHLAETPLECVLELWSGLGYYRRARNLHQAARKIVQRFDGRFPAGLDEARSLPGIGAYTSGAVLSIAYNMPHAVVDGNVTRVVARLFALGGSLGQPAFRRAVECHVEQLLSQRSPGDFNQALMQLGQTVCLPRSPRCPRCPLRPWCAAHARGNPESYPAPRPRRRTERRYLASVVILRDGASSPRQAEVLMVRGLDEGLLGELWNFPAAFGRTRRQALDRLKERLATLLSGPIRWCADAAPSARLRHGITYRAITVDVYRATLPNLMPGDSRRWFHLSALDRAAVSQLARKISSAVRSQGLGRGA